MMEIYDYMVQRATFEKAEHSLTKQFYRDALRKGCGRMFNVEVDSKGNVIRDNENVEFFKLWSQRKSRCI